jgi:hypothetical protein
VEKELAKTEKQSNTSQTVKIAGLDVFISNDIISFSSGDGPVASADNKISASPDFHPSDYYSRIFHPPLV